VKRGDPTRDISDAALELFVRWVHLNHHAITSDLVTARRVLAAYELNARRYGRETEEVSA
jgi:hypothetical protein